MKTITKKNHLVFCKEDSFLTGKIFCGLAMPLFIILLAISCSPRPDKNELYFKTVFKHIDSIIAVTGSLRPVDIQYLDNAFTTVHCDDPNYINDKYYNKYRYNFDNGNYDTAIIYADSAVEFLEKYLNVEGMRSKYINSLFFKGDANINLHNYDEAIRNFTRAKLLLSSANAPDSSMLFRYYNSMAATLYAQHKFVQAVPFFRMKRTIAPSLSKNPHDTYNIVQENTDNMGVCYNKAGIADSALFYFNETLDYINNNYKKFPEIAAYTFNVERGVVYGNIAAVLRKQHDTAAEGLFLKSYQLMRPFDSTSDYIKNASISMADLYFETNQPEKAKSALDTLRKILDTAEMKRITFRYYQLLSDYYFKKNQVVKANCLLQYAAYIKDSMARRDRKFITSDINLEFENQEQRRINDLLIEDNETKNWYLQTAFIAAGMGLLIFSMVSYTLRRKSHYANLLKIVNTEINTQHEDLQKTLSSLEQSHQENSRITQIVAHDLKNPVSAIRTLAYSLSRKEEQPADKETLELIQLTCIESITLINDLLDKKKITSPGFKKEPIDLGILIEQCVDLFQIKAGEKKQRLKVQTDYPVIMINRLKILKALSNIINNAIKFSPENTEILIKSERKENGVVLSIHDNGIGIPAPLKNKIFTFNQETSGEGAASEETYGLGLPIASKIVEEHDGRIWFESEAGEGSVFYIQLPFSES